MKAAQVLVAILVLAACGADRTDPPASTQPTAVVQQPRVTSRSASPTRVDRTEDPPTQPPRATTRHAPATPAVSVEGEARQHCPAEVAELYDACVGMWIGLVELFPDRPLVLCVWPDGRYLIAEPGTERAGTRIGDACVSSSSGAGTVTWIVNEAQ